jgi:hypothetical protein
MVSFSVPVGDGRAEFRFSLQWLGVLFAGSRHRKVPPEGEGSVQLRSSSLCGGTARFVCQSSTQEAGPVAGKKMLHGGSVPRGSCNRSLGQRAFGWSLTPCVRAAPKKEPTPRATRRCPRGSVEATPQGKHSKADRLKADRSPADMERVSGMPHGLALLAKRQDCSP